MLGAGGQADDVAGPPTSSCLFRPPVPAPHSWQRLTHIRLHSTAASTLSCEGSADSWGQCGLESPAKTSCELPEGRLFMNIS